MNAASPSQEQESRRSRFVALLSGQGGWARPNPYLDTPTEPMQAFALCVEECAGEPAALAVLGEAVVELSRTPDWSWFAAYYVVDLLEREALFGGSEAVQRIVDAVLDQVASHRAHLTTLRRWAGAREPEGCWTVVDRLLRSTARRQAQESNSAVEVRWPPNGLI